MNLRTALLLLCLTPMTQLQNAQSQNVPSEDASSKTKANVVFVHGNVYTGVTGTSSFHVVQRAEAIAITGDRILAVGSNEEVLKSMGPQTEVVDLGRRFVMPGFNDAHLHLAEAGLEKLNVNLVGVKSLEEFRERVRAKAETAPPGEWIIGGGWDETLWPVRTAPTRWDVDEVASKHPVFLRRVDGHIAVANARALQLASITLASRDPQGGKIDRDASGQPTGVLREVAEGAPEITFGVSPVPPTKNSAR